MSKNYKDLTRTINNSIFSKNAWLLKRNNPMHLGLYIAYWLFSSLNNFRFTSHKVIDL